MSPLPYFFRWLVTLGKCCHVGTLRKRSNTFWREKSTNRDLRSLRYERSMKWFNWFLEKTAVGSDIGPLNHPPLCWLTEAPTIWTGNFLQSAPAVSVRTSHPHCSIRCRPHLFWARSFNPLWAIHMGKASSLLSECNLFTFQNSFSLEPKSLNRAPEC